MSDIEVSMDDVIETFSAKLAKQIAETAVAELKVNALQRQVAQLQAQKEKTP